MVTDFENIKAFILSTLCVPICSAILLKEISYYFKRKTYLPIAFVLSCWITFKAISKSSNGYDLTAQSWIFWTLLLIGIMLSIVIYILDLPDRYRRSCVLGLGGTLFGLGFALMLSYHPLIWELGLLQGLLKYWIIEPALLVFCICVMMSSSPPRDKKDPKPTSSVSLNQSDVLGFSSSLSHVITPIQIHSNGIFMAVLALCYGGVSVALWIGNHFQNARLVCGCGMVVSYFGLWALFKPRRSCLSILLMAYLLYAWLLLYSHFYLSSPFPSGLALLFMLAPLTPLWIADRLPFLQRIVFSLFLTLIPLSAGLLTLF